MSSRPAALPPALPPVLPPALPHAHLEQLVGAAAGHEAAAAAGKGHAADRRHMARPHACSSNRRKTREQQGWHSSSPQQHMVPSLKVKERLAPGRESRTNSTRPGEQSRPPPMQRAAGRLHRRTLASLPADASIVPPPPPLLPLGRRSASRASTVSVCPARVAVQLIVATSKTRIWSLLVDTARWVGCAVPAAAVAPAAAVPAALASPPPLGPLELLLLLSRVRKRMSVTSSLLPTSWRSTARLAPPPAGRWNSRRQSCVAVTSPVAPGSSASSTMPPAALDAMAALAGCSYTHFPVSTRHSLRTPFSPPVAKHTGTPLAALPPAAAAAAAVLRAGSPGKAVPAGRYARPAGGEKAAQAV